LLQAAEMIATGEADSISDCMPDYDWVYTKEAEMFNLTFWKLYPLEKVMAIAIMLTMPSEIINHKCCKKC